MEPPLATNETNPPEATLLPVIREHIGVKPGFCGGRPHILGHRIKVKHVAVWHEQMGMSPAEIVATHPTITLADVHAALAYYYDHRAEVDAEMAEEERLVEDMKAQAGPSRLQEKLRQRTVDAKDDSLPPG
jgi:uncharacterized protein (DUF433 family)